MKRFRTILKGVFFHIVTATAGLALGAIISMMSSCDEFGIKFLGYEMIFLAGALCTNLGIDETIEDNNNIITSIFIFLHVLTTLAGIAYVLFIDPATISTLQISTLQIFLSVFAFIVGGFVTPIIFL